MDTLIWPGLIAFALALVLTPVLRDLMSPFGMLDRPDRGRKLHKYPVPHVGGVAIAVSFVAATLCSLWMYGGPAPDLMLSLLPGASVIFAVGLIDDFFQLKPRQKLIGQILGVSIACGSGLLIPGLSLWLAIPMTFVWLLTTTNAFNLVDGMDGLAAGIGVIACLGLAGGAVLLGQPSLAAVILPFAACLAAFLIFNFSPASVFLGDSGSLTLGYLLGCFVLLFLRSASAPNQWAAPVVVLALPLLEVLLTVLRRSRTRLPVFTADRRHIHHRMLDSGMSSTESALALYGVALASAILGLLEIQAEYPWQQGTVLLVFLALCISGIRFLRYEEFEMFGLGQTPRPAPREGSAPAKL